jgi:hypothetical protein
VLPKSHPCVNPKHCLSILNALTISPLILTNGSLPIALLP